MRRGESGEREERVWTHEFVANLQTGVAVFRKERAEQGLFLDRSDFENDIGTSLLAGNRSLAYNRICHKGGDVEHSG